MLIFNLKKVLLPLQMLLIALTFILLLVKVNING